MVDLKESYDFPRFQGNISRGSNFFQVGGGGGGGGGGGPIDNFYGNL